MNQMYAAQNNGKYVANISFDEDGNAIAGSEWIAIPEYYNLLTGLSSEASERESGEWVPELLCPSINAADPQYYTTVKASYGINYMLNPNWGSNNLQPDQMKVESPAKTVAFGDATDWLLKTVEGYTDSIGTAGQDTNGYLAFRHGEMAHVVYFDGSVEALTREDVAKPEVLFRFTRRAE
jgi:prepilin-type processing-associated H-X9-DG protein